MHREALKFIHQAKEGGRKTKLKALFEGCSEYMNTNFKIPYILNLKLT